MRLEIVNSLLLQLWQHSPDCMLRECLVSVGMSGRAAYHALTLSCSARFEANFWTFESSSLLCSSPKMRESAQICHTFQAVAAYSQHPPVFQCATINRTASVFQGCMLYNTTSTWQLANTKMLVFASRRQTLVCVYTSSQHHVQVGI